MAMYNEITVEAELTNTEYMITKNYNLLENKPQINSVELIGNKSLEDLGINPDAEENIIDTVKVNGVALTPDANKAVDVTITTGTNNGTVKVNGTDVNVKGLKSAAYTESSAYDIFGAAATVQRNVDALAGVVNGKVDKVQGKGLSQNDYTNADKTKLAGIQAGAQVNTVTSVAGKTGAITLNKSDVGLANVDNTSDANKPVSNATQTALDLKVDNVEGKGLSTNDFSNEEKTNLANVKSEVENIRIGADGTTYASAGDSVRGQIGALNNTLIYKKNISILHTMSSTNWNKKENYMSGNSGWTASNSYDSYYFTADSNCKLWVYDAGASYTQLCIYPSGDFNDPNYARYRTTDHNLPTEQNQLSITSGTMIIFTVVHNATNPTLTTIVTINELKAGKFEVSWDGARLDIVGNNLNCYFSDATFLLTSGGLFELQALTINDCLIFGTENDYIGPVKVKNQDIIGAKHGGETTDSVKIFIDGGAEMGVGTTYSSNISIYVTSHIDTRFSRVSTYTINRGKLSASSLIIQNADLNIESIFGAGIISSYNNTTLAWINNYLLSAGDTTGNLGEQTIIVTNKGNITSRRTMNKSAYTNSPVYFLTYSGRKKLYYYNTYRVQNTDLPSGSVYSSACDLMW